MAFQKNYFRLEKKAFWFYHFAIVDTNDHKADEVFISMGIPVHFGKEFVSPGNNYRIVFVKVRKKYGKEFLKSMRKLSKTMVAIGNDDYDEFCAHVQRMLTAN